MPCSNRMTINGTGQAVCLSFTRNVNQVLIFILEDDHELILHAFSTICFHDYVLFICFICTSLLSIDSLNPLFNDCFFFIFSTLLCKLTAPAFYV